jgi:hypothetical protein
MSRREWEHTYRTCWRTYYSTEHIETVLRRAVATGVSPGKTLFFITWFKGCVDFEGIHPLEGGFWRIKYRRDRRPGLPLEPAWRFYPSYFVGTFWKQVRWLALYLRLRTIYYKIKRDSNRYLYMDAALEPVADDELESREMFQSEAAAAYVERQQRKREQPLNVV